MAGFALTQTKYRSMDTIQKSNLNPYADPAHIVINSSNLGTLNKYGTKGEGVPFSTVVC